MYCIKLIIIIVGKHYKYSNIRPHYWDNKASVISLCVHNTVYTVYITLLTVEAGGRNGGGLI